MFTDADRDLLVEYFYRQPGQFKVMPRDLNAVELGYQASVYVVLDGTHLMYCDVYRLTAAQYIVNAMNAQQGVPEMNVLSTRQLVDMLRGPV